MAANVNPVDIKPDVRKTVYGFGSFKVALADVLTVTTVLQLATFFEYPPVIIEELGTAVSAGLLMIRYMEERGQIKPTNILTLLSALKEMCLSGTEERVKKLYEEHTGRLCSSDGQSKAQEEGKIKTFANFLKHTYALWYNRIQPIPYIREKMCCVDAIYVESGLELDSQSFEESSLVSLKSFRDIFDINIIPSNRILLEGDPGYGKSTLTLQAAYDWCLGNVASPLKNVAVFILLPLRLLGNISSIFEAIRVVLMPKESPLTDDDILEILRNGLSVVIVLDGYDEYPDKNSGNETDVMDMIAGKMFPNIKVVVSTRSSSLPKYLHPTNVTIRLTGFDEKSRDGYIQRTVTGGDQEASKRITNALNNSPILNDICQVPMFCVLFAHVANDQKGVIEFSSVTSFFKYVIDGFYSHMWKKDLKEPIDQSIREYSKLNRLAFDSLTGKTQIIAWPKRTFIDTVGNGCYEELSNIGILIVDKTHEIINEPEEYDIHHTKQSELVRFYHKLFAEWFAARYLSSYAGSFWPFWLKHKLNKINPVDLQFVFRFACGLNKKASGRIIKYLKSVEGGASFASVCLFEQPDDPEEVVETVNGLCSDGMIIRSSDSRLLQRSNIQILDIASRKKIPISELALQWSFSGFDGGDIRLQSGLSLSSLSSVEKISINAGLQKKEFTEEEVIGLINYGIRSPIFKELWLRNCKLPSSINPDIIPEESRSRNIKVISSNEARYLDLNSGQWRKPDDIQTITEMCSDGLSIDRDTSESVQRSVIELLVEASNHDVPIDSVTLGLSFSKIDEDGNIILSSGLSLPIITSIERMCIQTEQGREMNKHEVNGILNYVQHSQRFKQLSLYDCLLPSSIPVGPSLYTLKSRGVEVFWTPDSHKDDEYYRLDLDSGRWEKVGSW